MIPKRVASPCRCGWCCAHGRAAFPRAFGGGSKMRPDVRNVRNLAQEATFPESNGPCSFRPTLYDYYDRVSGTFVFRQWPLLSKDLVSGTAVDAEGWPLATELVTPMMGNKWRL
jgi:hypothetical protein